MRIEVINQAMRIRRWSLAAITASQNGSVLSANDVEDVADIPLAAWSRTLRAECAALPVARALRSIQGSATPEIRAHILELSLPSVQRCMTARVQIRELDDLCVRHGLRPVLLKGGASIAQGAELDLGDLDVFLPPADAARFADVLDQNGYARASGPDAFNHLARRCAAERLPVEIHPGIHDAMQGDPDERLATSVVLSGARALRILRPSDHAWYVLHHCVEAHPHRQGSIRDVLALAFALDRCTAADIHDIRGRATSLRCAEGLIAMLDFALAVQEGHAIGDPFDRIAAARYVLGDETFQRFLRFGLIVYAAAFAALDPRTSFAEPLRLAWRARRPIGPGSPWYVPTGNRVSRLLARVVGRSGQAVYRAGATLFGMSIAAAASRSIRRACHPSPAQRSPVPL